MSFEKYAKRFKKLFGLDLKENHDKYAYIKVKGLDENAIIPTYAHDGDIGMDITAISMEYDAKNDTYIYHTGLSVETTRDYGIFLYPRSSNCKTDCYLGNHVGVVDSYQYRGELMLCFKNRTSMRERNELATTRHTLNVLIGQIRNSNSLKKLQAKLRDGVPPLELDPMSFAPYAVGDRIAQMVVSKVIPTKIIVCANLSDTDRGSGGFGSTGK